ncbi:MAG: hypothetical protein ACK4UN_21340 [Limisphaerales bacterium]
MNPPPIPQNVKQKLTWYQHLWLALPFGLVAVGGAIGGACGGAAWGVNRMVFEKTNHPVLRYVWTGLISFGAVITYLILATVFVLIFKREG